MAASRGQVLKVDCQLGGGNSRILMTDKGALPFKPHEMTTVEESESSYHFLRSVRSISFGVEYATDFWDVSQPGSGFRSSSFALVGGRGPGFIPAAVSRTGDGSAFGALANSRDSDRGGLVHSGGSASGDRDFSVLPLGLPRTRSKRAHGGYTGGHRIFGCRRLFDRCKALWKAQIGRRSSARQVRRE